MSEKSVMYGGVEELNKIRKLLEAQADVKKQTDAAGSKKKELEKELETVQTSMQSVIDSTVKRRREQVVSTFDKELANAQDKMRAARESKDKEKTKKVNKRIDKETAELVRENKNITEEKKTYLKQKNISSVWDNPLIYIMYFPKTLLEKLEFALIALLCLVGVPLLVTKLVKWFIVLEILLFIVIMALFVGLYMLPFEKVRMQNRDAFLELYRMRKDIKKNNKKIKKIKKRILKDKDESRYDLGKFDNDINDIEDRINDIVRRKNEALSEFEKTTKSEIANEIKGKDKPRIDKIKDELDRASDELKKLEDRQKDISLDLTTGYGPYIGIENLNVRTVDAMIEVINDGRAKNISEAMSIVKVSN